MDQRSFDLVDQFLGETIVAEDEALRAAVDDAAAAGLPAIQVSPPQGRLLQLLARLQGARTILEFGTLGGYSTILLARALPAGGRLVSLEAKPEYAAVARASIERAGLADRVEIRVGPALEALPALAAEGFGPIDLTFIDADKVNTPNYFAWALEHSRPGQPDRRRQRRPRRLPGRRRRSRSGDQAQRQLHRDLAREPRVSATTLQTVGVKGYDGLTIALVGP